MSKFNVCILAIILSISSGLALAQTTGTSTQEDQRLANARALLQAERAEIIGQRTKPILPTWLSFGIDMPGSSSSTLKPITMARYRRNSRPEWWTTTWRFGPMC
jgi:hypothetical protein